MSVSPRGPLVPRGPLLPQRLRLMVVSDRNASDGDLVVALGAAVRGGATAIQLREKDLPARALLDLARRLRGVTREHEALLIVNDRVDVALAADADGVHLGGASIPVRETRRIVGEDLVIGVSTHTPDEAAAAAEAGADYVVFGPVHETPSKVGIFEPRGAAGLRAAVRLSRSPIVAIGGLDGSRAGEARRAGASGIAVIRAVLASDDPEAAARELRAEVERGGST